MTNNKRVCDLSLIVSERKNRVLLLALLGNIGRLITTLGSVTKIVFMAMKSGFPFEYDFNKLDEHTLECAELLSDLDFLVESRLLVKSFEQIGTERVVTFKVDIEAAEMAKFTKDVLSESNYKVLKELSRKIRRNPSPKVIDRIFERFEEKQQW